MKKILLFAAMAVMAVTAGAQGNARFHGTQPNAKVYNAQHSNPRLTQSSQAQKPFQAVAPRQGLEMKGYAPLSKRLTLDPARLKPVARAQHQGMKAMQTVQPMHGKAFSKGRAQHRNMVNVKPVITLNEQPAAKARAARKAPAFAENYTALALNYRTKEVEQWTMTPATGTYTDEETGEETEVNALFNVIPMEDLEDDWFGDLSELFPRGIPVAYTIEDNIITIEPQAVISYQNEAQDTTFYVTLFSANSDDEDGVINMEVGEDGKLTITNGNWICFGEFANVEFDEDMNDSEAYMGWYELYANVTYYYRIESAIDQEYKAHGVDYFNTVPADWTMQRGTTHMDDEEWHYFVNMTPLMDIFAGLYPDGIDVEYTQEGNTITVEPQTIASYSDEEDGDVYIRLFSGVSDDGCIVLTLGDDGSLTTVDDEAIVIGEWSTEEFDPTYNTYLGGYQYIEKVKYRLPDAEPEAPGDVAFEPNELVLFAGLGLSGYSYNSNLGVMGAYAPVSFKNNTFDVATNFEWSVTEEDEEENVITGSDKDFGFTTQGGAIYYDFSLTGYNEGAKSEPFTWGKGLSFATDADGNPTDEKRYEDAYFYAGHGQGSFMVSDGCYATMTRQNPDLDLTYYVNFSTPDIAKEYDVSEMSTIYSYQGKPSTPLFITGVSLPLVSFEAQEDFNLHISLYKCTRTSTGNLELGDIIAEGDATTDNIDDTYDRGLTAIVFDELYSEDEYGMSETLDYLFIDDEFVIVIEGWNNGTFSGVLGSQKYSNNETTSTWFQRPGEERLRSYGSGWPTLFIGLEGATYGYLHTEDNTNLQFGAEGGEKSIHVDPMYYELDEETEQPTYSLLIEKITLDGEELEEVPEWLTIEVANEDYTTATDVDEDGNEYEYFVNGIGYDLVITADALPESTASRSAELVFMQTGARLKVTVKQGGGAETLKGDVNGDGSVDVADISAIISVMAGTASYDKADVNGDGSVDVADISNVISIMAEQ